MLFRAAEFSPQAASHLVTSLPTTLNPPRSSCFPPCKCFFDDLSVASGRSVHWTRAISGWMTLNPYRLQEHPPRPCLRRVTAHSFNPSWSDRQQLMNGNSDELAWAFAKFNIIVVSPRLQLYLNTVPSSLCCLYLILLLLSFYYVPVLCFGHQAANLFASEKGFGNKALSHLFILLEYPKYASSSLLPEIKSTYFFMGYFFFTLFFVCLFYLSTHRLPNQPAIGSLTDVGPVELPVARKQGRILPRPTSPPLS